MRTRAKTFEDFRALGVRLDMSRGKPSPEQLALSHELLQACELDPLDTDAPDCRNYGSLLGLPRARGFFADLLDVLPSQTVVAGNSSLALMHDLIVFLLLHGAPGSPPWLKQGPIRFICPVPGYDRHFSICETLGIQMINVPLLDNGPDIEAVKELVGADPSIKGMWCVPKYGNPTGVIYSDEVAAELAVMHTAAPDFRLLWDDAYRFHHLTDEQIATPNFIRLCHECGNPDRAFVFTSTSKITFASSGVAALAASEVNVEWWQRHLSIRTIGPDKINQLRHVHFLRDRVGVEQHMARHRAILQPRFDLAQAVFAANLGGVDGVSWTRPRGGYFIDLVTPPNIAKSTIQLAGSAGLTLTPAGASFPYHHDPSDRHIRVAPSFPTLDEIEVAAAGICFAVKEALSRARKIGRQ
jgi:DNA-binding transcriptional MocR family regulator